MNYTDFVDNLVSDHADLYDLHELMPIALYRTMDGFRLRMENLEESFLIDEDGYVIEMCENDKAVDGHLVWAATQSYSLVLGA